MAAPISPSVLGFLSVLWSFKFFPLVFNTSSCHPTFFPFLFFFSSGLFFLFIFSFYSSFFLFIFFSLSFFLFSFFFFLYFLLRLSSSLLFFLEESFSVGRKPAADDPSLSGTLTEQDYPSTRCTPAEKTSSLAVCPPAEEPASRAGYPSRQAPCRGEWTIGGWPLFEVPSCQVGFHLGEQVRECSPRRAVPPRRASLAVLPPDDRFPRQVEAAGPMRWGGTPSLPRCGTATADRRLLIHDFSSQGGRVVSTSRRARFHLVDG